MKLFSASPYNKDKKINLGGLGSFKLKVTKSYNKKQSLALVLDILRQCLLSLS
jgi:hypothetical protein